MRRYICAALAVLLIASLSLTALAAEQHSLAEKLVRLHVIANSDSDIDQSLKLKVRDALLECTAGIDESELAASLDELAAVAMEVVRAEGFDYGVSVALGDEAYGTREYDTFALPAGIYRSLRVTLGDGSGENWWCVLFPPLCFAAAEDFDDSARSAGLSDDEINFVKKTEDAPQIRFRILELLLKAASFLRD